MSSLRAPLSGEWVARFSNVEQLSAYAEAQPLRLANVEIVDYDITRARMTSPEFRNSLWQAVKARQIAVRGGVFKSSLLKHVHFDNATFINVRFENVTFENVSFEGAQLDNVVFEDCEFRNSSLRNLHDSTIEVLDSKLESTNLSRSHASLKVQNSSLTLVSSHGLKPGSTVEILDSQLDRVAFDSSKLSSLVIRDSELKKTRAGSTVLDKVVVTDSRLDFTLGSAAIAEFTATNSIIDRLGFVQADVRQLRITQCKAQARIGLAKAGARIGLSGTRFGSVVIERCDMNELSAILSAGHHLTVGQSKIEDATFEQMRVDEFTLTDVTFTDVADFTGAQTKSASIDDARRSPTLQLITTDSNIEL